MKETPTDPRAPELDRERAHAYEALAALFSASELITRRELEDAPYPPSHAFARGTFF